MKVLAVLAGLAVGLPGPSLSAQTAEETNAVMEPVHRLFDAMRAGDSALARSVFDTTARLISTAMRDGAPQVQVVPLDPFIAAIGTPHDVVWDERIWDWEVRVDDRLASVWTAYAFYAGEQLSHCGVDAFLLARAADGWKIVSLADTRRREGCTVPADAR